jgi:MFS family permease
MVTTNRSSSKTEKRNALRAVLAYTFRTAALLCSTGPLMQTFLSSIGFSEQQIYMHATLFQALNVITILLCSRFADTKKVLLRTALIQIPGATLFLGYLPLCLSHNVSAESYVWLLVISIMQSAAFALHTVCEYKVPYYIYRPEAYGSVLAICGIISSLVSFGVGSVMSALSLRYSYPTLMIGAFLLSCLFLLTAGALQFFQRSLIPLTDQSNATVKKTPLIEVFRHKAFSYLFIGNVTRGFASGVMTILAAAALSIGYDEVLTTAMVSVQSIASMLACFLFSIVSRHINPRFSILCGSLFFAAFPLLLVPERPILFLAIFALLTFGRTLVDYAIPAALLYVVPVEIAGTYNAWRMILLNGGTMLATITASFLPLPALFTIALICQLITGFNYFIFKNKNPSPEPSSKQ